MLSNPVHYLQRRGTKLQQTRFTRYGMQGCSAAHHSPKRYSMVRKPWFVILQSLVYIHLLRARSHPYCTHIAADRLVFHISLGLNRLLPSSLPGTAVPVPVPVPQDSCETPSTGCSNSGLLALEGNFFLLRFPLPAALGFSRSGALGGSGAKEEEEERGWGWREGLGTGAEERELGLSPSFLLLHVVEGSPLHFPRSRTRHNASAPEPGYFWGEGNTVPLMLIPPFRSRIAPSTPSYVVTRGKFPEIRLLQELWF